MSSISFPSVSLSSIPLPEAAVITLSDADVVARLRAAGCVFAEDEARLLRAEATSPAELLAMLDRRMAGVPLEQIVGWAEFCGLRIAVEPGVFVPRRRTEFLVRQAAALVRQGRVPVVVDLCCGSGAVGAAVAAAAGPLDLHAVDIDPAAVRCARRNVDGIGGRVYQGDLYQPLPRSLFGRVDVLVANAPYVPTEAIGLLPPEARDHEPLVALDGGTGGLEVQRRLIEAATDWLAPGGHLLIETSDDQGPRIVEIAAGSGLLPVLTSDDEWQGTVVIGAKPVGS